MGRGAWRAAAHEATVRYNWSDWTHTWGKYFPTKKTPYPYSFTSDFHQTLKKKVMSVVYYKLLQDTEESEICSNPF